MSVKLAPYLTFNGNCREAMNFYRACLGGELSMQTVAETPVSAQCPAGMQEHIMHSMLVSGDMVLMATDMTGPQGYLQGTDMALSLHFGSEEEARQTFDRLAEGGRVIEALAPSFWG
ncbi:MAG: VOC family protein [Bacteroidia bacterium]|nr:VOC family protein [Bacteroidia bacterium]